MMGVAWTSPAMYSHPGIAANMIRSHNHMLRAPTHSPALAVCSNSCAEVPEDGNGCRSLSEVNAKRTVALAVFEEQCPSLQRVLEHRPRLRTVEDPAAKGSAERTVVEEGHQSSQCILELCPRLRDIEDPVVSATVSVKTLRSAKMRPSGCEWPQGRSARTPRRAP